jgi:hypothetical protein
MDDQELLGQRTLGLFEGGIAYADLQRLFSSRPRVLYATSSVL